MTSKTKKPRKKSTTRCAPAKGARTRRVAAGSLTVQIPERWKWHYQALARIGERLFRERRSFLGEAAEQIERNTTHQADSATDEFEHELALSLLSAEEDTIQEVAAAMKRIMDGRYGVCELTGRRIPAARLKVIPWTRYCREAEERIEKAGGIPPAKPKPPATAQVAPGRKKPRR